MKKHTTRRLTCFKVVRRVFLEPLSLWRNTWDLGIESFKFSCLLIYSDNSWSPWALGKGSPPESVSSALRVAWKRKEYSGCKDTSGKPWWDPLLFRVPCVRTQRVDTSFRRRASLLTGSDGHQAERPSLTRVRPRELSLAPCLGGQRAAWGIRKLGPQLPTREPLLTKPGSSLCKTRKPLWQLLTLKPHFWCDTHDRTWILCALPPHLTVPHAQLQQIFPIGRT